MIDPAVLISHVRRQENAGADNTGALLCTGLKRRERNMVFFFQ